MDDRAVELRMIRWRAGIKQWELAAALGVDPTKLSRMENAREPIPVGLMERVREIVAKRYTRPA